MKVPNNCPICDKPFQVRGTSDIFDNSLIYNFCIGDGNGDDIYYLKERTHIFTIATKKSLNCNGYEAFRITFTISKSPVVTVSFELDVKSIIVSNELPTYVGLMFGPHELPYFEPDLSNFNKLAKKLKTYIAFS